MGVLVALQCLAFVVMLCLTMLLRLYGYPRALYIARGIVALVFAALIGAAVIWSVL